MNSKSISIALLAVMLFALPATVLAASASVTGETAVLDETVVDSTKEKSLTERAQILEERKASIKAAVEAKKEALKASKATYSAAIEKYKSERTPQALESAIMGAKEHLLNMVEEAKGILSEQLTRVQESPVLPDEKKAEFEAEINAQLSDIDALVGQINAASTKEEIQAAIEATKTELRETKNLLKEINNSLFLKRLFESMARADEVSAKMQEKIDYLKGDSCNAKTGLLETLKMFYDAASYQAKGFAEQAEELHEQETDPEGVRALLEEAKSQALNAHADIKVFVSTMGTLKCSEVIQAA